MRIGVLQWVWKILKHSVIKYWLILSSIIVISHLLAPFTLCSGSSLLFYIFFNLSVSELNVGYYLFIYILGLN